MTAKSKPIHDLLDAETSALREQVEKLSAMVRDAAKGESAQIAEMVAEAAQQLSERAAGLAEQVSDKAQSAKAAIGRGRSHVEDTIRERPLTAVSVAALARARLAAPRSRVVLRFMFGLLSGRPATWRARPLGAWRRCRRPPARSG